MTSEIDLVNFARNILGDYSMKLFLFSLFGSFTVLGMITILNWFLSKKIQFLQDELIKVIVNLLVTFCYAMTGLIFGLTTFIDMNKIHSSYSRWPICILSVVLFGFLAIVVKSEPLRKKFLHIHENESSSVN